MSAIYSLFEQLKEYSSVMELNAPLRKKDFEEFEQKNHILLPPSLSELLFCFNGGEIFVPGTTIYGVGTANKTHTIQYANRLNFRKNFDVPQNYLIFAKLNFGDFICINLNKPYDVIQWDHESNDLFSSWDNLEQWLCETIADYIEFENGVM